VRCRYTVFRIVTAVESAVNSYQVLPLPHLVSFKLGSKNQMVRGCDPRLQVAALLASARSGARLEETLRRIIGTARGIRSRCQNVSLPGCRGTRITG
jgi:hypothetical protein